MHTGIRTAFLLVIGALVGAAAGAPVVFFALVGTPQGQALIRTHAASAQSWPDLGTVLQESSGGKVTQDQVQKFLTTPVTVGVPEAYGTQAYAQSLNMFLGDIQALGTSTNRLAQLLVQLNNQALSGDFDGFFDLVVQAKVLVDGQKALSSKLSQDISALDAANRGITDAVTKAQTQSLLIAAKALPQDLNAYLASIDQLLSGAPPSAALIADMTAKAKALSASLTTTGTAMNVVLTRFKETTGTQ